jgi:O-antigen/teichoic acid export membrane protein
MAWYFSVEDIGRYSILQVLVGLSVLVGTLGLDQAFVREFYESKDRYALFKALVMPGFVVLLLVLVISANFSELISLSIFNYYPSLYFFGLLFFAIIFSFLAKFLSLILRMEERGIVYSLALVIPKLLFLMILLFIFIFEVAPTFLTLITSYVLSLSIFLLILLYNTRTYVSKALKCNIDFESLKAHLEYSLPLLLSGLAFWLLAAMDRFFLKGLSSLEELGLYSIAINFAGIAVVMQGVFSTIWVPTVFKWISTNLKADRIKNITNSILIVIFLLWSLIGTLTWLIPYILPEAYASVAYILMPCMAYPFLYALSEVTGIGIVVKKKTKFSLYSAMVALIFNAAGNYIFIPEYGAAGAASVSAVSFLIYFMIKSEIGINLWGSFNRKLIYFPSVIFVFTSVYFTFTQSFLMHWVFMLTFIVVLILSLISIYKTYRVGFNE